MTDPNTPGHEGNPSSPVLNDERPGFDEPGTDTVSDETHTDTPQSESAPSSEPSDNGEHVASSDEHVASSDEHGAPSDEHAAPFDEHEAAPAADTTGSGDAAAASSAEATPTRAWSVGSADSSHETAAAAAPASSDTPAASSAPSERPEHTAPPLSPPATSVPASAPGGPLHDDSALRAAEAARAGETGETRASHGSESAAAGPNSAAPAETTAATASSAPLDQDDVGDTRIVTPNGARSSAAWTPPPAPASPTEYAAPAAAATPTPYAPPSGQATSAVPTAPATGTIGTSPAERLGFGDQIAGGEDGFTPEEMAQRRAFRDEIAFRQKQEFAGINFGSAFFGWLAAVGLAGILYLIAGGITLATGLASTSIITGSSREIRSLGSVFDTDTLRITALVVFLVIVFVSYFVGGFVAGRMARFSGLKQGLAVWLWGVVMSIIVGVVFVVLASQSERFTSLGTNADGSALSLTDLTTVLAIVAEALLVVLSLGGALVGGLAGIRFHRRVDRFGFEEV